MNARSAPAKACGSCSTSTSPSRCASLMQAASSVRQTLYASATFDSTAASVAPSSAALFVGDEHSGLTTNVPPEPPVGAESRVAKARANVIQRGTDVAVERAEV